MALPPEVVRQPARHVARFAGRAPRPIKPPNRPSRRSETGAGTACLSASRARPSKFRRSCSSFPNPQGQVEHSRLPALGAPGWERRRMEIDLRPFERANPPISSTSRDEGELHQRGVPPPAARRAPFTTAYSKKRDGGGVSQHLDMRRGVGLAGLLQRERTLEDR
jgi:hypothetical protein